MTDKVYSLIGKIFIYAIILGALYYGLKYIDNKVVPLPFIGKYLNYKPIDNGLKRQLGL